MARSSSAVVLSDEPALQNWPGLLVTDARDVYDHLRKEGAQPPEQRSIAMELTDLRQDLLNGRLSIAWTSTANMLADSLTKHLPGGPAHMRKVLQRGEWSTQGCHDLLNPQIQERDLKAKQFQKAAKLARQAAKTAEPVSDITP